MRFDNTKAALVVMAGAAVLALWTMLNVIAWRHLTGDLHDATIGAMITAIALPMILIALYLDLRGRP